MTLVELRDSINEILNNVPDMEDKEIAVEYNSNWEELDFSMFANLEDKIIITIDDYDETLEDLLG